MSGFHEWVLDVTIHPPVWIPVEGMDTDSPVFVAGLSVIADKPPGIVRGIIHEDGQKAVNDWCIANPDEVSRIKKLAERR